MTATMTATVTASEAAYTLRVALGPLRAWGDFLADNIRGKQSVQGITLLPCCRKKIGGAYRPMYAVTDVCAFIEAVLAVEPSARMKAPVTIIDLPVDRKRPWATLKFNKATRPGRRDSRPKQHFGVSSKCNTVASHGTTFAASSKHCRFHLPQRSQDYATSFMTA